MDTKETFQALVGSIEELDAMERAIIRSVTEEREVPNFRNVLEEIGNAAATIKNVLLHYQGQRLPAEIENSCRHLLSGIKTCSVALVMYSTFLGFKTRSN